MSMVPTATQEAKRFPAFVAATLKVEDVMDLLAKALLIINSTVNTHEKHRYTVWHMDIIDDKIGHEVEED